ncbi:MAG: hypothetical protein NTX74_02710 [Flavobacterium sp.]|nr:hypothetical protein [Flavobacterium sp.]
MRILRSIFDFYIQSSLHVGLAVLALLHCTNLLAKYNLPPPLSSVVFWGTVMGYNFLKYSALFWQGKWKSNRIVALTLFTVLAGICFLYNLLQLSWAAQGYLLSAGLLVLCYPLLRKYGWLKLFFVSAAVTYITVFIPLVLEKQFDHELVFLSVQRFFLLSSLLIPFEIWDSDNDPLSLYTLPQRLGIPKTKILGYVLLLPVVALMCWQAEYHLTTLVVVLLAVLSIYFTSLQRSTYYTSFWVESVPILWWGILVLG